MRCDEVRISNILYLEWFKTQLLSPLILHSQRWPLEKIQWFRCIQGARYNKWTTEYISVAPKTLVIIISAWNMTSAKSSQTHMAICIIIPWGGLNQHNLYCVLIGLQWKSLAWFMSWSACIHVNQDTTINDSPDIILHHRVNPEQNWSVLAAQQMNQLHQFIQ